MLRYAGKERERCVKRWFFTILAAATPKKGMVVQGDSQGDHYGPVAVGKPDPRSLRSCERYARKLAGLTLKLFKNPGFG